jgi:hypothetical protein
VRADAGDGFDYAAWTAALPAPGADPDLVPILAGGLVALAGADGVLDPAGPGSSPRIRPLDGETPAAAVARALDQAAHGLRLREVLSGAAGRSLTGAAPVAMTVERRAADAACSGVGAPETHDPAAGVAPCDQLWLTLSNTGGKAQDISVLYFASDFAVQPIWPARNLANRLAPGESVRVGLMIEEGSPPGLEEIWVIAVPVDPDAPRVDLTSLATPGTTRSAAAAPDAAPDAAADASDLGLWLAARMDPDSRTRGFSLKPAPLTLMRQMVRLTPADTTPAIALEN